MKTGIIGFGSFGQFAAKILAPHAEVFAWSDGPIESDQATTIDFADFAGMDVIILAVPLDAYEQVLLKLKPVLNPATIVVDICSVKMKSSEIMNRVLEGHEHLLITHPLFGPESAAVSTAGHELIVCDATSERAEMCVEFCVETLGLRVTRISAREHDRVMAYVHVLTFFVARGLGRMEMPDIPFRTPSFNELMDLVHLDSKHSAELFDTVQRGNPFGDEVRNEYIQLLQQLQAEITAK